MSTLSLTWHWADRTSALGIAYASELPGEPRSVVVWGILGDRASSGALECALEEHGTCVAPVMQPLPQPHRRCRDLATAAFLTACTEQAFASEGAAATLPSCPCMAAILP